MWKKLFALLAVAATAGCVASRTTAHFPLQEFAVATAGDTLVISNLSSEPVYYAVLEEEFSTRARWAPCVPPAECPRVDAGQAARVPYASITGFQPGARKAMIFWYRVEGGGTRAREVRSRSVPL
ncbi:MAG: hypothetical protein KY444_10405 [Gemmatimonadetes bacterium]|nr:hypothetical protein [Gemmatimonadota bacterium]